MFSHEEMYKAQRLLLLGCITAARMTVDFDRFSEWVHLSITQTTKIAVEELGAEEKEQLRVLELAQGYWKDYSAGPPHRPPTS